MDALPNNDSLLLVSIDFQLTHKPMISVFDRGFMFGDSVYEVVRTYEGKLFTLEEHFARLKRSAERIYMQLPFNLPRLKQHLQELLAQVNKPNCYIRIIVSRGISEPSIEPPKIEIPLTVIMVKPLKDYASEVYEKGVRLIVPQIHRNPRTALDPMIKSGNYLNSVLALYQARQLGADDAVMLSVSGTITEASNSNVFFVKEGVLLSPTNDDGILDGITRAIILKLAAENHIPHRIQSLTLGDAKASQECFISSTSREVMPVASINEPSTSLAINYKVQEIGRAHV